MLFEVGPLTSISDYFLIAGGNSNRQVQAIAKHVSRRMKEEGFRAYGIEGEQEGHWVLMDYSDVVIHLFYQPVRDFYDLEGLWSEALRIGTDEDENGNREEP